MNNLITINLTGKTVKNGSGSWTPPTMTFGETLTVSMRFEKDIDGQSVETSLDVRGLSASVGVIDTRPTAGKFALKIGPGASTQQNTTAAVNWDCTAAQLGSAINALAWVVQTYGRATVSLVDDSFQIVFGTALVSVPLEVVNNTLFPVSFGEVSAWQGNNLWTHELRLVQAPVAFTNAHARVLPPQPTITEVQQGGTAAGDMVKWNEIQALKIPPEFRGTYQIRWGYQKTELLSPSDGPTEIQSALAMFGDGFTVTNPLDNVANIEFTNDFAGQVQPLLVPQVVNAPEGDLTFSLTFDRNELRVLLRAKKTVELPFDVLLFVADEAGTVTQLPLFRLSITIQRPLIWPDMAEAPTIDWIRPPSPRDYIPFTLDQVITGTQYYVGPIGDGEHTVLTVDHPLGTREVSVDIRENSDGGRLLNRPEDYTVAVDGPNSVTVTPVGAAIAHNAWVIKISSAGPASVFQNHTHTIQQIVNLPEALDALGERLTVLEAILPSTGPAATPSSGAGMTWDLGSASEILFTPAGTTPEQLGKIAPFMLPAVHNADASTALPDVLPAPVEGSVYTSATRRQIPGSSHVPSSYVKAGGFVASDGRMNYPATRSGATNSYYPTPFERELWRIFVNDKQFAVKRTFDARFALEVQLYKATNSVQWTLVIETAQAPQDLEPSPTGVNLKDLVWAVATPILSQQLILTQLKDKHVFGCRIYRDSNGITADKMLYNVWSGANDQAPASANFAIRARLINFDTVDDDTQARGYVSYAVKPIDGQTAAQAIIS